jgi:hypothetical protein
MTGDTSMLICKFSWSGTLLNDLLFAIRFVDRDMYMRYAGNGISHYKVDLAEHPRATASPDEPDIAEEVVPMEEGEFAAEGTAALGEIESDNGGAGEIDNGGDDDEDADHESEDDEELNNEELNDEEEDDGEGDGEDDGEDDNEDDLGAEDGEGGFVDLEDDEGYAPL